MGNPLATSPRTRTHALLVLIAFVGLLAGRDIAYELFLMRKPTGVVFAFWICAATSLLTFVWMLANHQLADLTERLSRRRVVVPALLLALMCAIIYVTTFAVIEQIGAGLFNLVDWGLAPVLTALLGMYYYKERVPRWRIGTAISLYLVGTVSISSAEPLLWSPLVLVALLSPICTAVSFPIQKWLMSQDGGSLTRAQVTFVRFAPAAVAISVYAYLSDIDVMSIARPFSLAIVIVLLGFVPLILLCYALVMTSLARFGVWQFAIPALAFFSTLHAHTNSQHWLPILGAATVLLGILAVEAPLGRTSVEKGASGQ